MKKIIIMLIAALAFSHAANAVDLDTGTREVLVEGYYNPDTLAGAETMVQAGFGYFLIDSLEVGVIGGYSKNNDQKTWNAGVFSEYNLVLNEIFVPFVGIGAKYQKNQLDMDEAEQEEKDAVVLDIKGGVKLFVSDRIAVSGALVYSLSNEEIFYDDDELKDHDTRFEIGVRCYF